jgi:hypothetical protein
VDLELSFPDILYPNTHEVLSNRGGLLTGMMTRQDSSAPLGINVIFTACIRAIRSHPSCVWPEYLQGPTQQGGQ